MQLVTFEILAPEEPDSIRHGHLGEAALGLEGLDISLPGAHRLGALLPSGSQAGAVADLNRALAVKLAFEDVGAPEVEADSLLPHEMLPFLRQGPDALDTAAGVLAWTLDALERYDGPDLVRAGVVHPRREVRLNAPVPRPGKLLGVARNYAAHAAEQGQAEPPKEPVLFVKASSAVIGPEDEVRRPRASEAVDYEGELAVVIGRSCTDVEPGDALDFVAGYTIANDVTARDFQNTRGQRFIGKSCDTFAPLGPALVTRDEVPDPQALEIRTSVSGELRQQAPTAEMVFGVAELIAFSSRLMTLEPGDVLLTGTPAGVGHAMDPPRYLREGDVVEVEIAPLGYLRSHVR